MKIRILEKIDSLILLTPHPDEFLNDTEVNSYYQSLELTGGNYLESSLNVSLFKMRKRQVRFSSDNDKWKNIGIAADITEMDLPDLNDKCKYILIENLFFPTTRKTISKDFFPGDFNSKNFFFQGAFSLETLFPELFSAYFLFDHDIPCFDYFFCSFIRRCVSRYSSKFRATKLHELRWNRIGYWP